MGSHNEHQLQQQHQHSHHVDGDQDFDPGAMYSQEWVQDLVKKIQGFIKANATWIGLTASLSQRMLDYACGHGTISLALANEHPNSVFRGLDSHPNQVTRYNEEARKLFGEGNDRMYAIQGDLDNSSPALAGADWNNFDVAVISMALHHMPEPVKILSQLRKRLNTGGALIVVEWYEGGADADETSGSDNLDQDAMITVNGGEKIWAGFTPKGLSMLLERAGLSDVDVKVPGISFRIPDHIGGPLHGHEKNLMFVKAVNKSSPQQDGRL